MPSSFGGVLRRWRSDAGLSLSELAKVTYFSKGYLSKVENGQRRATEGLARACDAALGAEGALIGKFVATNPSRVHLEPPATNGLSANDLLSMITDLSRAGNSAPVDADVQAHTLSVTFAGVRSLGQQMDPTLVLSLVAHQMGPLLAMTDSDTALRDGFAARCAEFAGWMAEERGDVRGALLLTRAAMDLAERAGDWDLVAHTWVRRAELALRRQDAPAVLEFAGRAQRDPRVSARVRALGACVEARAHALLGEVGACAAALDRAELVLSTHRDAADAFTIGSSTVDDLVGATRGWCDLQLGRNADAAHRLSQVVGQMPRQARRMRGVFAAAAGTAYAAMGEPELACEVGRGLLNDVRYTRSTAALAQVQALRKALRHWREREAVKDLDAELADLLATAAS